MSQSATVRTKKLPPAPLEYLRRWPIQAWLVAVTLFLYVPLISLMVFSFNDSKSNIAWHGFSFKYYIKAFHDSSLSQAFINSLTIAACSTAISVVLGAMAAVVLWRFRFPGKTPSTPPWRSRSWCRKSAWASPCWSSSPRFCHGRKACRGRSTWAPSSSATSRSPSRSWRWWSEQDSAPSIVNWRRRPRISAPPNSAP